MSRIFTKPIRRLPFGHDCPLLDELLGDAQIYAGMTEVDLREMSKFSEQTNIRGLPVHPIQRPARRREIYSEARSWKDLPRAMLPALRAAIRREPSILARGCLAGGCRERFEVSALVSQSHTHIALGLQRVLWPLAGSAAESSRFDLCLIFMPDFDDQAIVCFPEEGIVLLIGIDDLRAGLLIALEAAHRRWMKPLDPDNSERMEPKIPPVRLLPGGSFWIEPRSGSTQGEGEVPGGELIFSGESIPDQWEKILVRTLPALAGRDEAEPLLAGAEPWVAREGGGVCPMWFNPLLSAPLLGASERWTRAAFHPDALAFGVRVNERGDLDLAASHEESFVIVPRRAVPAPFARSASPAAVGRLLTHRFSRPEAMEFFAMGFPMPELFR